MMQEEKKSAEQLVYDKVEAALYKRRLAPGTALTEQSLCDALGVGRTPVRGALRRLSDNGFVELIANRGAFVVQAESKQILQLYETRNLLELYSFKNSHEEFTEEDLALLQNFIDLEESAFINKELKTYLSAVYNFHIYYAQKCGNPYLMKCFKQLSDQLNVYLALYDRFYIGGKKKLHSFSIHRKMIEATREHNVKKFEKCLDELKKTTLAGFDFEGTLGANVGIALLS